MTSAKHIKCKEKDFSQVRGNEASTEEELSDEEFHVLSAKRSIFVTKRKFEKNR